MVVKFVLERFIFCVCFKVILKCWKVSKFFVIELVNKFFFFYCWFKIGICFLWLMEKVNLVFWEGNILYFSWCICSVFFWRGILVFILEWLCVFICFYWFFRVVEIGYINRDMVVRWWCCRLVDVYGCVFLFWLYVLVVWII